MKILAYIMPGFSFQLFSPKENTTIPTCTVDGNTYMENISLYKAFEDD